MLNPIDVVTVVAVSHVSPLNVRLEGGGDGREAVPGQGRGKVVTCQIAIYKQITNQLVLSIYQSTRNRRYTWWHTKYILRSV